MSPVGLRRRFASVFFFSLFFVSSATVNSYGAIFNLDLPTVDGDEVINGARYLQQIPDNSTGSGTFDPFLAIGGDENELGYNHDLTVGDGAPFMHEDLSKTENIQMSSMPVVTVDNVDYVEFLLDAGEPGSANSKGLDLVELQVFTTTVANQIVGDPSGGLLGLSSAILRYDMDGNEDNTALLDGSLSPGNGKRDLAVLIPVINFSGASPDDFVVVFTQFALADGTFEEWGRDSNADRYYVPEPSSLSLLGIAMVMLGSVRRIRHSSGPSP